MTKTALGLFGTWAVHDLEELLTMSSTSRRLLPRLPRAVPIPDRLRRDGVSTRHAAVAIAAMGALTAAAAAEGVRTQGRSPVFRGGLLAFGVHGFAHLAVAAAARQYVTGVATAPTVVIPYWLWARRELVRAGLPEADRRATAVAVALVPALWAIHALAHRLVRD